MKTRIHHQHKVWERNYRDCAAKLQRKIDSCKFFIIKMHKTKYISLYVSRRRDAHAPSGCAEFGGGMSLQIGLMPYPMSRLLRLNLSIQVEMIRVAVEYE